MNTLYNKKSLAGITGLKVHGKDNRISGFIVSGIIDFACLHVIHPRRGKIDRLNRFQGLIMKSLIFGILLLFGALRIAGFSITSVILGADLVLTHSQEEQWIIPTLFASSFFVLGMAVNRNYPRLFLGQLNNTFYQEKNLSI